MNSLLVFPNKQGETQFVYVLLIVYCAQTNVLILWMYIKLKKLEWLGYVGVSLSERHWYLRILL